MLGPGITKYYPGPVWDQLEYYLPSDHLSPIVPALLPFHSPRDTLCFFPASRAGQFLIYPETPDLVHMPSPLNLAFNNSLVHIYVWQKDAHVLLTHTHRVVPLTFFLTTIRVKLLIIAISTYNMQNMIGRLIGFGPWFRSCIYIYIDHR